jgi:hypothetical protein
MITAQQRQRDKLDGMLSYSENQGFQRGLAQALTERLALSDVEDRSKVWADLIEILRRQPEVDPLTVLQMMAEADDLLRCIAQGLAGRLARSDLGGRAKVWDDLLETLRRHPEINPRTVLQLTAEADERLGGIARGVAMGDMGGRAKVRAHLIEVLTLHPEADPRAILQLMTADNG